MDRQATPVWVPSNPERNAEPLTRIPLQSAGHYDEGWIQSLIYDHPSILPISSIEPAFWPAVSVCRELPLRSGYLDNLLLTPTGDLIAVECKLWRNGEARREVIAQVIDYAKDLQALAYEDLQKAVQSARKDPAINLFDLANVGAGVPERDEIAFTDNVSRNLRNGRALLLIVGDGITENVQALTEFLQQHAGLHFALALVQLSVHHLPGTADRIVVPSVPMRTTNITRGIVRIEDGRTSVVLPVEIRRANQSTTLSEDEMFAALDQIKPGTSDRLLEFLNNCVDLQVSWEIRKTLMVRMTVGPYRVLPLVINADGSVDTGYTVGVKEVMRSYAQRLSAAIPGTMVHEAPKSIVVKMPTRRISILEVLDHASGCRDALEELNRSLLSASGEQMLGEAAAS